MQNIKLAWIFCWDAAFLLQRKCKRAQWKLAFKLPSAGFLLQRYNKKQLFAIVCSDFVLKSAHIFNIYTENQAVTKPLNISHLKKESVSFLSKSFLSFSKNKNTFHLYKEYIYILYRTFFHFKIENDKNDFDKNDKVSRLFVRFLKVIISHQCCRQGSSGRQTDEPEDRLCAQSRRL